MSASKDPVIQYDSTAVHDVSPWSLGGSQNVRVLLPDTGTTAFDRLALGLCTVRWHPNACTLVQGHTGAHRAADGSALVATHGSGDLEPGAHLASRTGHAQSRGT